MNTLTTWSRLIVLAILLTGWISFVDTSNVYDMSFAGDGRHEVPLSSSTVTVPNASTPKSSGGGRQTAGVRPTSVGTMNQDLVLTGSPPTPVENDSRDGSARRLADDDSCRNPINAN